MSARGLATNAGHPPEREFRSGAHRRAGRDRVAAARTDGGDGGDDLAKLELVEMVSVAVSRPTCGDGKGAGLAIKRWI